MEEAVTKHEHSAATRTITSRRELLKALERADLTHTEELVLRMRLGIDEPESTELQFRGTEHPELAARLAMIESDALKHLRPNPVDADVIEHEELKSAIIDDLRDI